MGLSFIPEERARNVTVSRLQSSHDGSIAVMKLSNWPSCLLPRGGRPVNAAGSKAARSSAQPLHSVLNEVFRSRKRDANEIAHIRFKGRTLDSGQPFGPEKIFSEHHSRQICRGDINEAEHPPFGRTNVNLWIFDKASHMISRRRRNSPAKCFISTTPVLFKRNGCRVLSGRRCQSGGYSYVNCSHFRPDRSA